MGERFFKIDFMEKKLTWIYISLLFPCFYARTFQYEIIQFLQFLSYPRIFHIQWDSIYDSILDSNHILALQIEKNSNGSSNSLSYAAKGL